MMSFGFVGLLALVAIVAVVVGVANVSRKPSEQAAPRGFPWISMFVGIVVLAGIATFIVVQSRPITYVLNVTVPAGKGFIGEVIVDGRREIIEDIGSKPFEFTCKVIRWRVLIDDEAGTDSISVQLTGGAGGSSSSTWGAAGFSEKQFIGGRAMFTSITEDEWRTLMRELKPENEGEDSLLRGFSAPSNQVDEEAEIDVPAVPPGADPSESSAGA